MQAFQARALERLKQEQQERIAATQSAQRRLQAKQHAAVLEIQQVNLDSATTTICSVADYCKVL